MSAAEYHRYPTRKATPIKRADGESFTRQDVQCDLLNFIFTDDSKVFTELKGQDVKTDPKLTFGELYVNSLVRSSRCSKPLRDKILENRTFSRDFAKVALLVNVGRINSSQAFYPEMRTALRTYHPIPCLAHTDGNLQDAPRIKGILRGCSLPDEGLGNTPTSLNEILELVTEGRRPPTSVVNLVFVLAHNAAEVAGRHFPATLHLDFLDLFLPCPVPSASRARTFLWLMYHYLEGLQDNPFDDNYTITHPGKSPYLYRVEPHTIASENVDTLAEITWGQKMAGRRAIFMERQIEPAVTHSRPRHEDTPTEDSPPLSRRKHRNNDAVQSATQSTSYELTTPNADARDIQPEQHRRKPQEYPRAQADNRTHERGLNEPFILNSEGAGQVPNMLEYAWRSGFLKDPLAGSDDESCEGMRRDNEHRLFILNRIRGHPPSPDWKIKKANKFKPVPNVGTLDYSSR